MIFKNKAKVDWREKRKKKGKEQRNKSLCKLTCGRRLMDSFIHSQISIIISTNKCEINIRAPCVEFWVIYL